MSKIEFDLDIKKVLDRPMTGLTSLSEVRTKLVDIMQGLNLMYDAMTNENYDDFFAAMYDIDVHIHSIIRSVCTTEDVLRAIQKKERKNNMVSERIGKICK